MTTRAPRRSRMARVGFVVLVVETLVCVPTLAWNLVVRWQERHDFDG